jgi:Ca2+-binding RTX toxin-like protein
MTAALVGVALLLLPTPSAAGVSCSLSGATLSIGLIAPQDAASVIRVGTAIEVRTPVSPVPCGGSPTVTTVDTVLVSDSSPGTTTFTIDLSGGPFAPGASTGGEGTSPEIEFQVDLGGQFPDRLAVVGSGGADALQFSGSAVNLNASETPPVDPDVTAAGVEEFEVRAGGEIDDVSGTPLIGAPFGGRMIVRGEGGADELTGGSGPDDLFGGPGDDLMDGAAGADRVAGEDDIDTLVGGAGTDDLFGGAGSDDLDGESGDDRLDGGTGADTENGSDGADIFDQGPAANGSDALGGGPGFDVGAYDLRQASLVVEIGAPGGDGEAGEADVIDDDVESVLGGSGNDVLTGADLQDNVLRGGPGADTVDGGTGDDTVDGDAGPDSLSGGGGDDTVSIFGAPPVSVNLAAGSASGDGGDLLAGFEHAEGGSHADALVGGGAPNVLTGRGGNDTLVGEGGNDLLRGNGGDDTASYAGAPGPVGVNLAGGTATGQGTDALQAIENATGGPADDSLAGSDLPNMLLGGGGNDAIVGGGGGDALDGQAGQDAIHGDSGADRITGGDGNDAMAGSSGADVFQEGAQKGPNGGDSMAGGPGRDLVTYAGRKNGLRVTVGAPKGDGQRGEGDTIQADVENVRGTEGRDVMTGNGRRNVLTGSGGQDVLRGKGGRDRLVGGAANDRLDGGPGNDVCRGGGGRNVLTDCDGRKRRQR